MENGRDISKNAIYCVKTVLSSKFSVLILRRIILLWFNTHFNYIFTSLFTVQVLESSLICYKRYSPYVCMYVCVSVHIMSVCMYVENVLK